MRRITAILLAVVAGVVAACEREAAEPESTVTPASAGDELALRTVVAGVEPVGIDADHPVITSDSPQEIALTIYTDDLALVTETRTVSVPQGQSVIRFEGVSDLMIPQSAILREFAGFTLERNFDFDLLTPAALYDGATGHSVKVIRTNPYKGAVREETARVVSGGAGVVLEIDGRFEALNCAGLPEKSAFDRIPDGLDPQPTLSIQVTSETAGEAEIVLSYLASGFGWAADYRLDLNEDETGGKLVGWLTVRNDTEVSIRDASTAIIAGQLQRLWETRAEPAEGEYFAARCWPRGSSKTGIPYYPPEDGIYDDEYQEEVFVTASRVEREMAYAPPAPMMAMDVAENKAELEKFGDYKLYRVPFSTTVAAYQEKQLMFIDVDDVELDKIFSFEVYSPNSQLSLFPATISYHVDNSRDGNLGMPLPKGNIRVMTKDQSGDVFYLGQDSVRDLAVDLPAEFAIGTASDIQLERRQTRFERQRLENGSWEYTATIENRFFNASTEPAMIELKVGEDYYAPISILRSDLPQQAGTTRPEWRFRVEPESSRVMTYTARWIG